MKNIKELEKAFALAKEQQMPICVAVSLPNQKTDELIINSVEALESKLEYYKHTYDKNLVHKSNKNIKIKDAFPIMFYYDEIDKEISEDQE
ncbi:MAG: hypothetical protein HFE81_03535 [Bacilli bacterium]|nr:hypothetical protein [Bacilli bacterium]